MLRYRCLRTPGWLHQLLNDEERTQQLFPLMATAGLAAWITGRRAAPIRPTAALAEAAVEPRRIGGNPRCHGEVIDRYPV